MGGAEVVDRAHQVDQGMELLRTSQEMASPTGQGGQPGAKGGIQPFDLRDTRDWGRMWCVGPWLSSRARVRI